MKSYNTFTYIIILVTNLCLFRSLVYSTKLILIAITYSELTLMANLFLFQSPVGHIFILISRRSSQNLCLYRGTLRYYKVYTYTTRLILILQSLHLFGGTSRYYRDYICITELILVLRNLFLYRSTRKYYLFNSPKRHILVLVLLSLFLYYGTYSCLSDLILVLLNLFLSFGSYTCSNTFLESFSSFSFRISVCDFTYGYRSQHSRQIQLLNHVLFVIQ